MFRKWSVKIVDDWPAADAQVEHQAAYGGVGAKKSPDVETTGLRYLDLISVEL
jgi:hypothetical protein